ncbi:MAG: PKD domain-containing protein [Saprospiraceae bacterium]|nr:PKD domain-containing protein [Saprospiraceae bacterium]
MRHIFVSILLLTTCVVIAQKHDNIWFLGYGGGWQLPQDDEFGLSILSFEANKPVIQSDHICDLDFYNSDASYCDSSGNLLFFSNAERVYNKSKILMQNGNNLNVTNSNGARYPQGALALPVPLKDSLYLLLVLEQKYYDDPIFYAGYKIYKNIININGNNGLGKVVEKKTELIVDTLEWGQLSACKHANGHDWWILVPEVYANRYYTFLLDSSGVKTHQVQSVGTDFTNGLGQAAFSPDGTKYIRTNSIKIYDPVDIYIYDFDRCDGSLSNPVHIQYPGGGLGVGCAISPDSRFLYASNASFLYQYDLMAPDIASSAVLVSQWDGYVWDVHWPSTFAASQLAPDGKIYISSPGTPFLHVIDYPNRKGLACDVRLRGVALPTINLYSIPNFPNFRLGPIDGSACDTSGLDNHPLCNWRWAIEDSSTLTQVTFLDLSAYEPTTWLWDFGDGQISTEVNPVHAYAQEGVYQVCLTVANAFSADTFCQTLHLGVVSSVEETGVRERVRVYPNPADQHILFDGLPSGHYGLQMEITAPDGKVITAVRIPSGQQHWLYPTADLTPGVYLYRMISDEQTAQSGRFVVMH